MIENRTQLIVCEKNIPLSWPLSCARLQQRIKANIILFHAAVLIR